MAVKHLYVHIPFCRSRCAYCDFPSEAVDAAADLRRMAEYLLRLRKELTGVRALLDDQVETVYLGGGTPTVVPRSALLPLVEELAGLQRAAVESVGFGAAGGEAPSERPREFTIEVNPATVDLSLLEDLQKAGVTRLSVGVQSFSDRLRETLGRGVSRRELDDCVAMLRRAGLREWNLDLIHGIPGATFDEAITDVERAIEAGPTHISLYDLTYTPGYESWLTARIGSAGLQEARDRSESHFSLVCGMITRAGYERYEVSSFALPGHECRHNSAYWAGREYLGIGASAVSTVGNERRSNPRTVAEYTAGVPFEVEHLDERTLLWEKAMLGLRTAVGVDEEEVGPVLDSVAARRLLEEGYLERRRGKLRLKPDFLDLGNSIIAALLAPL